MFNSTKNIGSLKFKINYEQIAIGLYRLHSTKSVMFNCFQHSAGPCGFMAKFAWWISQRIEFRNCAIIKKAFLSSNQIKSEEK